jgi:glycosyltransferase involved in cell wall biosynthesis
MKVLLLCLRSPFPPADGGAIAMYNMARSLKKAGMQVKILAFNTRKHFVNPAALPENFREDFDPEMVYLDATVKLLPAAWNLLKGDSYNVSRFDSGLFHRTLSGLLQREQYDIIQMESLFMTPYLATIRKYSQATIVFRSHNVEFVIWKRLAGATTNRIKKWYLNLLSGRLKKYESAVINQVDGLIALTDEDKEQFITMGCKKPIAVLPIGVDTETYPVKETVPGPLAAVHLGSMDWLPNIEGINWFLENVFPLLRKKEPSITIYLAGKKMPQSFFDQAGAGLVVDGTIEDARNYLEGKQIMLVPLLSGGGMRVKIIEGLAMGKTIVSTTIGAEGIHYRDRHNMLIADTPETFSEAIVQCNRDPGYAYRVGKEARKLAEEEYENSIIGRKLFKFYQSVSGIATGVSGTESTTHGTVGL